MSVQAGSAKLKRAAKDLQTRWNETRYDWHDENSRQFEEHFLKPLFARLRTAEHALGNMSEILNKVRRDCE